LFFFTGRGASVTEAETAAAAATAAATSEALELFKEKNIKKSADDSFHRDSGDRLIFVKETHPTRRRCIMAPEMAFVIRGGVSGCAAGARFTPPGRRDIRKEQNSTPRSAAASTLKTRDLGVEKAIWSI
jgi:hypothetical protein